MLNSHNPIGFTVSDEIKYKIAKLLHEHQIYLIEDDEDYNGQLPTDETPYIDEEDFLNAFLDGRFKSIQKENENNESNDNDVFDRLKTQQRFIKDKNFDLKLPLDFKMNGENFHLDQDAINHYNDQDLDFDNA